LFEIFDFITPIEEKPFNEEVETLLELGSMTNREKCVSVPSGIAKKRLSMEPTILNIKQIPVHSKLHETGDISFKEKNLTDSPANQPYTKIHLKSFSSPKPPVTTSKYSKSFSSPKNK